MLVVYNGSPCRVEHSQPDAGFSAPPSPPGQASGRGGSRHQGRGRPQNKSLVTVTGIFRQDEVSTCYKVVFSERRLAGTVSMR